MRFKNYLAPSIGLSITLPIFALIGYFLFNSNFSLGRLNPQELYGYFQNTLFLSIGTFIVVLVLGISSAYLNARFEYFGSRFFSVAFLLPLSYPAYILGYCYVGFFEFKGILAQLLGNNFRLDILNLYGAIFIFGIAMYAYVYVLARVSFASISSTIGELVSLHKLSPTRAFFKVYLPLAYPAIFAGSLLAIMETLSDYGTVVYFGIDTFSVGIFKNWFGYGDLLGAINVAMVLLVFIFSILFVESKMRQKYRFASSTHSGQKLPKIKLQGRANVLAFSLSFLISLFALFIPTGVLLYWFALDFYTLDFDAFIYMYHTLSLNILSSFVIIILSFFMIYFMRFYPSTLGTISHKLSILGYSIPGAVVAIGVLIFSNMIDSKLGFIFLGGSLFALIFAYATRYFAVSVGSIENGFSKIDKTIDDAIKIFSRSEFTNFFTVYLPLMKPYMISGFLILYIDIAKELPATLLLRPFNFDTMAIRIYELASNEMLYKVAFPSLLLVLSTAIAVFLLNSKRARGRK